MSPSAAADAGLFAASSAPSALNGDDEDDISCPLCLDEMDVSDLSFKPCPCGYQICRFCWHYLKETLGKPCPACRKDYDENAVEFTPMKPDEIKHLENVRKQREREKKDSQNSTRRHLASVRVKHKSQVHIQGLTSKTANDDTLATLKSPDHYGQYGKINRIFLSRKPPGATASSHYPVHLYVVYARPHDAAACMAAIDGTTSSEGTRLRASFGTTKYCSTFLKGQRCLNDHCMGAHEMGEEIDSGVGTGPASREHMSNLKSAFKDNEARRSDPQSHPGKHPPAGPSSASTSATTSPSLTSNPSLPNPLTSTTSSSIQPRLPKGTTSGASSSQHQGVPRFPKAGSHPLPPRPPSHARHPSASASASDQKSAMDAKSHPSSSSPSLPATKPPPATSGVDQPSVSTSNSSNPAVDENLVTSPPPGLTTTSTSQRLPSSQSPSLYFPSTSGPDADLNPASAFADFDQTLGTFDGGSFSFSLDVNAKGKQRSMENMTSASSFHSTQGGAFESSATDSFPTAPFVSRSSSGFQAGFDHLGDITGKYPSQPYSGSFNPFDTSSQENGTVDNLSGNGESDSTGPEDSFLRKSSRFKFARSSAGQPLPGVSATSTDGNGGTSSLTSSSSPINSLLSPGVMPLPERRQPHSGNQEASNHVSIADIPLGDANYAKEQRGSGSAGYGGKGAAGDRKTPSSVGEDSSLWSGINLEESYSNNALPLSLSRLALSPEVLASLPPLPPPTSASSKAESMNPYRAPGRNPSEQAYRGTGRPPTGGASAVGGIPQMNSNISSVPLPASQPQPQPQQHPNSLRQDDAYSAFMNLTGNTSHSNPTLGRFPNDYAFQDPAILNMRMTPSSGPPPGVGVPFMGAPPSNMEGQMGMGSANANAAYQSLDSVAATPLVEMGYRDGGKDAQ